MIPGDLTSEKAGPILADWSGEIEVYIGPDTGWIPAATLRGTPVFALHQYLPQRLNPARPEVRDHAARWLARHHGVVIGPTAPYWQIDGWGGRRVTWGLGSWEFEVRIQFTDDAVFARIFPDRVFLVPGISTLTDPAEALILACLAAGAR